MKLFGIDISRWQGDFNFSEAIKQGVKFVIIKGGGGDGGLYTDRQFVNNYNKALQNNLPKGCYWFSKALSSSDAIKEAEYFYNNCLKGRQFELPVYIDIENKEQLKLSKRELTDIIIEWCNYIRRKGFLPGIYSSKTYFDTYMYDNELQPYEHWIAQWSTNCTYQRDYGMWQFGGEINKIQSNKIANVVCDQDYMLKDYPSMMKERGLNGFKREEAIPMSVKTSVNDVVKYALNEVGYIEKATNSQLDSKTANAGSNNFTKYTRDVDNSGLCDARFQGQAWCCGFVLAIPLYVYNPETVRKLYYLPTSGCKAYNCGYLAGYFQKANAWYTTPEVGDLIFFQSFNPNGSIKYNYAHVGLVIEVTSTTITTIEGNTSGASGVISNGGGVCKKQYSRNYKGIKGFGRPCYDVKAAKSPEENTTKLIQLQVRQLRKGMSGDDVRTLMLRLKDLGFYSGNITSSDKEFGPKMDAAVREFQSTNKLTVDGIIGNQTWSKILQF